MYVCMYVCMYVQTDETTTVTKTTTSSTVSAIEKETPPPVQNGLRGQPPAPPAEAGEVTCCMLCNGNLYESNCIPY